jgi:flagellar hook-basal body complex protein FliE
MIDAVSALGLSTRGLDAGSLAKTGSSPATGFADVLSHAVQQASERLHAAEDVSVKALTGEATARETVDAVLSAERALQVAVAVRDKAVTAWLEISRMAI